MKRDRSYLKLSIPKRKMEFGFDSIDRPFFFDGNGILSTYFAAMSVVFPPGEKEFVRSVGFFASKIEDPELREKVKEFSAQEAQHRLQHKRANERLDEMGYCATEFEQDFEEEIQREVSELSDEERLAGTVCAEHITAVLGHAILSNPELIAKMDRPVRDLLYWHAVEELEHKAVAFDVYESTVKDMKLLRRALAVQTYLFCKTVAKYQLRMMWKMKYRPSLKESLQAWQFFMGPKNGLIGKLRKPFMEFYRKDFHPWDVDDRALIEKWKSMQEQAAA